MAHLIQIYQSDNNFHSRSDLEKIELGIFEKFVDYMELIKNKYVIQIKQEKNLIIRL